MQLVRMKGTAPSDSGKTSMETLIITPDGVKAWKAPPFQRPLRVNAKIHTLVEELKREQGIIPGIITLGLLERERYVVDGQHRLQAFLMAELKEGLANVRLVKFDSMGEMGEEFVRLNSRLVVMRPDDMLRGMEARHEPLATLRKKCPFIGYDFIRRRTSNANASMLGMSLALRAWFGSASEVPHTSFSVTDIAQLLTNDEAKLAADFYSACFTAWGTDLEYSRLWGNLNLLMVAWLWRRIVPVKPGMRTAGSGGNKRWPMLTPELFGKCLMSLSASAHYGDWLLGRSTSERDRSPAYSRVKSIFSKRILIETGTKPRLPSPSWAMGHK